MRPQARISARVYTRPSPTAMAAALFAAAAVLLIFSTNPALARQLSQLPPFFAPVRPAPVTVRWEDTAQREVFVIEGEKYECRVATNPARILSLSVEGRNALEPGGIEFSVSDTAGNRYRPAGRDTKPNWKVWRRAWVPATNARARMNIWSAGPYYWDAHLLDIPLVRANADPSLPPLRGEVVFHAHPDQLRIEIRINDGGDALNPAFATAAHLSFPGGFILHGGERNGQQFGRIGPGMPLNVLGMRGSAISKDVKEWNAPLPRTDKPGENAPGAVWIMRPHNRMFASDYLFAEDLNPLPASAVTVTNGTWRGFDTASGLYRVDAAIPNPSAFSFEEAFQNPLRRLTVGLRLRGDPKNVTARWRRMVVQCRTKIGNLEAAVLTDPHGFPLPTPTQVSKNFDGEREEPDDSAYGDSYFPVQLQPGEETSLRVVHTNQNWGIFPLKQVSSLRFFNIYWHLSTGSSETTCFTHDWMQIGNSGFLTVPDFRPRSGPFWPGQPQHDCLQWPGFLQYNDTRLMYERTVFESVSPLLSRFTMHYRTSDDAAKAQISVMEIPQNDEARTFVTLRYVWHKAATISGDARENFRWLNLFEKRAPQTVFFTDRTGKTQSVPVKRDGTPLLNGEPLAANSPFVATLAAPFVGPPRSDDNQPDYHSVVLLRSFRAKLGGKTYDQAALSAKFGPKDGSYWLTVAAEKLDLIPGDFIEADVMLMPHAGPAIGAEKAETERTERFGASLPTLTAHIGAKITDFPATVRVENEVAQVTVSGGFDLMPLIVEGFQTRPGGGGSGVPLLWRGTAYQNPQTHGGEGYQIESDGKNGFRYVLLYPIRAGQQPRLTVTRVVGDKGISRVYEDNGSVVIEAPSSGIFTLRAPVLCGPGGNLVTAGVPISSFTGTGAKVRSLPVTAEVTKGDALITLNAEGTEARITPRDPGIPVALTFGGLVPGALYTVTATGSQPARQTVAPDGTIRVVTLGAQTTVTLRPLPPDPQ